MVKQSLAHFPSKLHGKSSPMVFLSTFKETMYSRLTKNMSHSNHKQFSILHKNWTLSASLLGHKSVFRKSSYGQCVLILSFLLQARIYCIIYV